MLALILVQAQYLLLSSVAGLSGGLNVQPESSKGGLVGEQM